MRSRLLRPVLAAALLAGCAALTADDPLPSWNDGPAKESVTGFVRRVTTPGPEFVPEPERIAVFDNDGTLWAEQPLYVQAQFALDRVRALGPRRPEWAAKEPFASALRGDDAAALDSGEHAALEIVLASHAGTTPEEFDAAVRDWLASARHPATGRPYTDMVYVPMLELLDHLRAHGFKTFIVSGGGVEFLRAFAETTYGIPPEQVVGSSVKTKYEVHDGTPVLARLPEIAFVDDGPGKPVGIQTHVGRRPIAAFGNSDGDLQMLQWTAAGPGPRLALLVRHTDADREWAYDRASKIGRLDAALDAAQQRGWTVVDMKRDWRRVFAHEGP
jgi:phosphoglycolate phosphatase-like HAD superfamily hydrolase